MGLLLAAAGLASAATVHTNPMNYDPRFERRTSSFYNLDFPVAVADFQQFRVAHPGDPQASAYLLNALIFQELYRQDLLDTTFYANDGFLTGHHATAEDPDKRDQIFSLADAAVRKPTGGSSKNPNDVDALFARAWVRALRCAYVAMVERAFSTGFRWQRRREKMRRARWNRILTTWTQSSSWVSTSMWWARCRGRSSS